MAGTLTNFIDRSRYQSLNQNHTITPKGNAVCEIARLTERPISIRKTKDEKRVTVAFDGSRFLYQSLFFFILIRNYASQVRDAKDERHNEARPTRIPF